MTSFVLAGFGHFLDTFPRAICSGTILEPNSDMQTQKKSHLHSINSLPKAYAPTSQGERLGSLTARRLLATFTDWTLLIVLGFIVEIATPLNCSKVFGTTISPLCVWAVAYFSFFLLKTRTTPGKELFGIFTVERNIKRPVSFFKSLGRELIYKPAALLSLFFFWYSLFSKHQPWVEIGLTGLTIFFGQETVRFFRKDGRDLNDILWNTKTFATTKTPLAQKLLLRFLRKPEIPKH